MGDPVTWIKKLSYFDSIYFLLTLQKHLLQDFLIHYSPRHDKLEPHYNTHFGVHSDIVITEQPYSEGLILGISSGSHA